MTRIFGHFDWSAYLIKIRPNEVEPTAALTLQASFYKGDTLQDTRRWEFQAWVTEEDAFVKAERWAKIAMILKARSGIVTPGNHNGA